MAELVCADEFAVPLEVADSFRGRLRGLLGRESIDGALLIPRTSSVHTFGMRFEIDIAFLDASMFVLDTITMKPYGLSLPRRRSRAVVEANAGAFAQWGLRTGCRLEVRP